MAELKLKLQVMVGDEIAIGPGKAALLEAIRVQGSISAAARAIGMSYRRAWLLVDTANRCFQSPLVEAVAGGGRNAGARLTREGETVLDIYRQMEAAARGGVAPGFAALGKRLVKTPATERTRPASA